MSDQKILFIKRRLHHQKHAIDKGHFVSSEGNVYEFDLTPSVNRKENDFLKILMNIMKNEDPIQKIDKSLIMQTYDLLDLVDENIEMNCAFIGCEITSEMLLAFYNDKLICLSISGNQIGFIDDNVIQEILDILNREDFYSWEILGQKYSIGDIKKKYGIDNWFRNPVFYK